MQSTVPEEDLALEVTNTTGTVDNHCRYRDTINILKGQKIIFIQTEITVTHTIILIAHLIHPILLGIP